MSSSDHSTNDSSSSVANSSSSPTSGIRGVSSSPSSASASKKTKLDENSATIEIDKFLECTICLDFPASPIHACDNAHVLCGRCAPKFVACPTCQLPTLRPSPLGEKLAKEAKKKIDCANFEAGCKEAVLSTQLSDHLTRCYFREIICDYKVDCGVKVPFHEYPKHLEDVHKENIRIGPKSTKTYYHFESRPERPTWTQFALKFAGQQFIFHAKVSKQSGLFICWVSVMGDKDLGDKFIVQVKFKNNKSDKLGCSWTLPVLAFHDVARSLSEAQLIEYSEEAVALAVPMAYIKKWGKLDADQIRFSVTYEIKKV